MGEPSQLTANQRFCYSDFVTKWGFGQDGSGDSKNIFRIALLANQRCSRSVGSRSVVVDPEWGGGRYSVSVNYQSLLSNLVPLARPQLSFSLRYRQNRLFPERFLNYGISWFTSLQIKRTEILQLATYHIAYLCNQLNHVFALLISMPDLKSIISIKICLKLNYFCKMQNFRNLLLTTVGGKDPDPQNSPPLQISSYAPELTYDLNFR